MSEPTLTPNDAVQVLFQAAKAARLTFDEHQLVGTAYRALVAYLSENKISPSNER